MRKYLTNGEFRKRVRQKQGDRFEILSNYQGENYKVKIKCNKCGWVGKTTPHNLLRTNYGSKCPKHSCFARYNTDTFMKKMNEKQNSQYTLLSKFVNLGVKVTIKCNKCGEVFNVYPGHLLHRRFGKDCKHHVELDFKQASILLDQISNKKIKLVHFSGMSSVATFKCCKCGNVWRATATGVFHSGSGCPNCAKSKGEKAVTEYLKKRDYHFESQFRIKTCRDKKTLPFDFAVINKDGSLNSLIEYQGCQHFFNPFQYCKGDFFNKESVLSVQKHDAMKLSFCKKHGIKLIYINHPQTTSKSNKHSFIANLVKRTLDKKLKVS